MFKFTKFRKTLSALTLILFMTISLAYAGTKTSTISYGSMSADCRLTTYYRVGTNSDDDGKGRTDMVNPDWSNYRVWVTLRAFDYGGNLLQRAYDSGYSWGEANINRPSVWEFRTYHSIDNANHSLEYVSRTLVN